MFFKKKQQFYYELKQAINVEMRFIGTIDELFDYVEEQQEEVLRTETTGSVVVQKTDESGELFAEVKIEFPISEEETVESVLEEIIVTTKKKTTVKKEESKKVSQKEKQLKDTPEKKEQVVVAPAVPAKEEVKEVQQPSKPKKEQPLVSSKLIKIVAGVTFSIVLAAGIGIAVPKLLTPSYQSLIEENQYVQAVQIYPDRKAEIEKLLFEKGVDQIEYLMNYVDATQSPSATFDLAYLTQDFEKVVSLKEEATTPIRKTELAVSYVKTGKLDEAYELNQALSSSRLGELITNAYRQKGIDLLKELKVEEARVIQQKIPQSDLTEKLNKVSHSLQQEQEIQEKLKNSELKAEEKEELEKQLTQVRSELERYRKGEF